MNNVDNDLIILNNLQKELPVGCFPALAQRSYGHRLSTGADGLMMVERPRFGGDYRMLLYNSDGSAGEMCGNKARCICRCGYEIGLAGELQRVETTAGLATGQRVIQRQYKIELNQPTALRPDYPVEVDGKTYPCSYVELGDLGLPHVVVPLPGLHDRPETELFTLGRRLRAHSVLPEGASVNLFDVEGSGRIWEHILGRGVEGSIYTCGTNIGSVAAVLALQGAASGRAVVVQMAGGGLVMNVERRGSTAEHLFPTGPTNIVAKGELTDKELSL